MPPDPVVVVGAGPTGLLAALLLGRSGTQVLVLERHLSPWPLPRAVHLDDEGVRLLQRAGVADDFAARSRPARGLRLVDAHHRVLASFDRLPGAGRHGWPPANLFDQPDLEALLRDAVAAAPGVELRAATEVERVEPGRFGGAPAVVTVRGPDGARRQLRAAAVLGCDGAASALREVVGGGWTRLGPPQEWLVVDGRCAEPPDAWDGVHQVCDRARASTYLRVGADRCRWEFEVRPGESEADLLRPAVLDGLLAPWTDPRGVQVLRAATYTFRAGVADRWRSGRLLLVGDAAHLTPPFVGQGLGSGLRDAANLTWKLQRVLDGRAPLALLDSYATERRAHARSLVRLAVLLGTAMAGGGPAVDLARRVALGVVTLLPGLDGRVLDLGSPPLVAGPLVATRRRRPGDLVGRLPPQPRTGNGRLLDDRLGPGFAVLHRGDADPALSALAGRLEAPLLEVAALHDGGVLARWLGRHTAVVLRPDRTVLLASRSPRPGADLLDRGATVLELVGASG